MSQWGYPHWLFLLKEFFMRPRQFKAVTGQTTTKYIMKTNLLNKAFPAFSAIVGEVGCGKSTLAEICALALTCEVGGDEPCLTCKSCVEGLNALNTSGRSNKIVKINAAMFDEKKDMNNMISEIFDLKPLVNSAVVYIIEEFQELSDTLQSKLLEELGRIEKDTYIIICSSKEYDIIRAIRSRAFTFKLTPPSREECFSLIDSLTNYYGLGKLADEVKYIIVRKTSFIPREIDNLITNLRFCSDFNKVLFDYLNVVDRDVYVKLLEACFKPHQEFVKFINLMKESGITHSSLLSGLEEFFLDMYAYMFGGDGSLFKPAEKELIGKIFKELDVNELGGIVDFISGIKLKSEAEAFFKLVRLKDKINNKTAKDIRKESQVEAVRAKNISEKAYADKQSERVQTSLNVITEESLKTFKETNVFNIGGLNLPKM